jgi:serine/threonine-protein kinase HipA
MSDSLVVILDDAIAGTLTRLPGGRLRFDYDDEYRNCPSATPLSVSMSPLVRSHPDGVITPWLWGLLPDSQAVLDRWAREFHVSATSPFSLLATPIGHDCPGAVRFATPDAVGDLTDRTGQVTWLTDDEVAQRLRDLREDSTAWLGRDFTGQFSLAGAQAKTALLHQDGRWGIPSGAAATSHILKPVVAGLDDHDLNEHLCLDAARRAGLVVARTRVASFGGESAIVVDRYDRRPLDGQLARIHQEDVCQALSIPPARKYQNEGGPGPKEVARLLRAAMPPRVADGAVWRFFDALAWNWLIAGTDAHAKNYSLLLAGGDVRLAPLYDVASALPYGTHERKLRFAMKIGGDYRVYARRNTWEEAAKDLDVDPEHALTRVRELAAQAPDAFADAAAAPAVASLKRPLPGRLVDLLADRVDRCVAILNGPSSTGSVGSSSPSQQYISAIEEIDAAVALQRLAPAAGHRLISDAAVGLRAAVDAEPRDISAVRTSIVELAADALRVVRSLVEAGEAPGLVNPTAGRLPAMIDDFAPNTAGTLIAPDDPVRRLCDELVDAAHRYAEADPRTVDGSGAQRIGDLFRIVGLAGHGLAVPGAFARRPRSTGR